MTSTATILYGLCALAYVALAATVLPRRRVGRSGVLLAGAAVVTAAWAGAVMLAPRPPFGAAVVVLELARPAAWFAFLLHLYRRTVARGQQRRQAFFMLGMVAALALGVLLVVSRAAANASMMLWLSWNVARLGIAVCSVLLIENLYFNTAEDTRWHVNLPCVALGALSVYDIALTGDALLFHGAAAPLFEGRAVATILVAPLLALAAGRNRRRWEINIQVSRSAAFHSATLLISGIFLIGLVIAGEALRYFGAAWGGVAEISLIFAGLVTIAVLLTSRSARSVLRRAVVDHFFSHRYDYRREWLRCIATLAAPDAYVALHTRVIRAVADVVDSPAGALFLREPRDAAFHWAGAWNMPAVTTPLMADHGLVAAMRGGDWVVEAAPFAAADPEGDPLAGVWLAVPLRHGEAMTGFILAARPRAPFALDREVYDLLRMVGRQVAAYVAEQRATEVLLQTRELHEFSKRFAFVAHDIKNVSSQLSLLLSNAEIHMDNPDFRADMLATIRASVAKISALIRRLQAPGSDVAQALLMPGERIDGIVANIRRVRGAGVVELAQDSAVAAIAMPAAAFDAVVTHLLDNAIEATQEEAATRGEAPPPVRIALRHEDRRAQIDIVDEGAGMTPEFVRDELFRPLRSSKRGGSGIGAYQARELLRSAGGDLLVLTRPGGGTTMRLLLPLVEGTTRGAVLPAGASA
ncbi:MAG: PEP-CTERM system histidine kinase PrsK [Rhodospirillales bacterium]|nr:PEP-CTERM system histidine kinase PrsK [Rhodospirillales bacterium]